MVDGFADFTGTQHEILEILADRVDELLISLPGEEGNERDDLFAKALSTTAELRRRLPRLTEETIPRSQDFQWPAMAHLERELFLNPRRTTRASDGRGIEIVGATQSFGEIQWIGNRIKGLLTRGDPDRRRGPISPAEMMVVFRSLRAVEPLVREVFGDLGIPFALEIGQKLDRSPALASLVSVLKLDHDDWPLHRLLAALRNNYFQPSWPQWHEGKAANRAASVIRKLQWFSGKRDLLAALDRRRQHWEQKAHDEPADAQTDRGTSAAAEADECSLVTELLTRLSKSFDLLPQRATAEQWADALARFAEDVGFLNALGRDETVGGGAVDDRAAWDRLQVALATPDELARLTGDPSPLFDRTEFLRLLTDTMQAVDVGQSHNETGRVRILSAASARSLRVPYLFVAGLSERSFPPPDREDRIYTEAEYRRLADAGLPLILRDERGREERLLFYEVVTRATEHITLSYPAIDEKAQPLLPSPFLADVERLFERYRHSHVPETNLSPVPRREDAFSQRALRLSAVARALEDDGRLLADLTQIPSQQPVVQNILAGLSAIESRGRRPDFGAYEGMLSGDAVVRSLAADFGPQRAWSPSVLELYMQCPYRFFLGNVLGIEPTADAELEIDFGRRGSLIHDLLASLHRERGSAGQPQRPAEPWDKESYQERCRELLDELLKRRAGETPLAAAMTELDRRKLLEWIEQYPGQYSQYRDSFADFDEPPEPAHFEVAFGMSDRLRQSEQARDPLSTTEPLKLSLHERTILISGMIDRIDLARRQGAMVFNVVDYKTGKAPGPKALKSAEALQLALYTMAAEELLLADQGAVPWRMGYWRLGDDGFKQPVKLAEGSPDGVAATDQWQQLRSELVLKVHRLVQGIRSAQFPMYSTDDQCTGSCPYSTVCRVNQTRSLEKTWRAPDPN